MIRTARRTSRALLLVAGLAAALANASCRGERRSEAPAPQMPLAHRGPIVLITVDALRADMVSALGGPPGLTPHFDRLAAEAAWAGRAVAPSSWTVPSMGALFTGLQPWSAQSWSGDRAVLAPELVTLPEALKELGFRTTAFRSNHWLQQKYGYDQGFDQFQYLKEGKRAERHLEALQGGPELVWIHILPPHAPYVRRDPLLPQVPRLAPPEELPHKVRPLDLEPYFDPAVPLPAEQERVFRTMYALNVAWADQMLGRMLDALRRSGRWDESLVVVTADHGEEFGEHEQIAHGGNLGRQLIEVPLMIKLPAGSPWKLALPEGRPAPTIGVRGTLLRMAGGEPEEETSPGFFDEVEEGVLSELYLGNGANQFSYVEGDLQLLWESVFADPEPEYYRARYEGVGGRLPVPLAEPGEAIFARLENAFARALPLTGAAGREPRLTLWRWTAGGAERVDDPRETERMARRLKRAWLTANGREKPPGRNTGKAPALTPEEEAEMRNLGYVR